MNKNVIKMIWHLDLYYAKSSVRALIPILNHQNDIESKM